MSVVSRVNGMTRWMARNFLLREVNAVLKINKTLIRPDIEYSSHALDPVSRHGNWSLLLRLEGIQRRVTKIK